MRPRIAGIWVTEASVCVPTVVVVVRCSRANRACFEKSAPLPLYGLSRGRRTPSSSVLFPAALSPREPAFPCLFFFFQVPPPSSPYAVSSVERERGIGRGMMVARACGHGSASPSFRTHRPRGTSGLRRRPLVVSTDGAYTRTPVSPPVPLFFSILFAAPACLWWQPTKS